MTNKFTEATLKQLYRRPGFLLRRAHQLSVGLFAQQCKAMKLTPPQFGVLYVLAHISDTDQAALSRSLGFDKVTTFHIVRGLEGRGLLTQRPSLTDRRKLTIRLTSEGKSLLDEAQHDATTASDRLLSPLLPAEREQFLLLLEKLCNGLEDEARAPIIEVPSFSVQ